MPRPEESIKLALLKCVFIWFSISYILIGMLLLSRLIIEEQCVPLLMGFFLILL